MPKKTDGTGTDWLTEFKKIINRYISRRYIGSVGAGAQTGCGLELFMYAAAAAKSLQLCPTLCDPIDGSPPGSPIPGILQARTLEWVAISFSNA